MTLLPGEENELEEEEIIDVGVDALPDDDVPVAYRRAHLEYVGEAAGESRRLRDDGRADEAVVEGPAGPRRLGAARGAPRRVVVAEVVDDRPAAALGLCVAVRELLGDPLVLVDPLPRVHGDAWARNARSGHVAGVAK